MSSPEMGEEMEPRKETEKEESRKCEETRSAHCHGE